MEKGRRSIDGRYPRNLHELLRSDELAPGHPLREFTREEKLAELVNGFLELRDLPGFEGTFRELLEQPVAAPTSTNEGPRHWESKVAELEALWIVRNRLCAVVVGFNAASPRRMRPDRNCEFEVMLDGRQLFVEVKAHHKHAKQRLPRDLAVALSRIRLNFDFTPQLIEVERTQWDFEALAACLQSHVSGWEAFWAELDGRGRPDSPHSVTSQGVKFIFHERIESDTPGAPVSWYHLDPASMTDIRRQLVGGGGKRAGHSSIGQAMSKGADILFFHFEHWARDLRRAAVEIFADASWIHQRALLTKNRNVNRIEAIFLVDGFDSWILVQSPARSWGRELLASLGHGQG